MSVKLKKIEPVKIPNPVVPFKNGHAELFSNIGFLQHKFSDEEMLPIRKEVNKILNNFEKYKKQEVMPMLAGNLAKEYELIECKQHLANVLNQHVVNYTEVFDYLKSLNFNLVDSPIVLEKVWVNFQKKYEFNPIHVHSGILTFVIFLDIPYLIEDEIKKSPGSKSIACLAGHFEFIFHNTLGAISSHYIPADKSYENVLLMFPSKMPHCAYPFYTSNKYRITISGNFSLDNTRMFKK